MARVWFITGTSKGFGRVWAEAALQRGDQVVATARNTDSLSELTDEYGELVLPLELDVTDKAAIDAAVERARDHFGRLDIVINNAGYGLFGAIEELTEEQARAQMETNFFGALWVTKAAIPHLREQGSGHIIQVSSIGGVHAFPILGLYHASKWALEAFSQSLSAELADYGVKVTIIEPGGYSTDWSGPSSVQVDVMPEYEKVRETVTQRRGNNPPGDPQATGPAILDIVDASEPPLRIFFGAHALEMLRPEYEQRLANWEKWNDLSKAAHGGG
jgi:NAD(P)-dependent dehydrogenase (short-subunit alcohol dehydrogenase family)